MSNLENKFYSLRIAPLLQSFQKFRKSIKLFMDYNRQPEQEKVKKLSKKEMKKLLQAVAVVEIQTPASLHGSPDPSGTHSDFQESVHESSSQIPHEPVPKEAKREKKRGKRKTNAELEPCNIHVTNMVNISTKRINGSIEPQQAWDLIFTEAYEAEQRWKRDAINSVLVTIYFFTVLGTNFFHTALACGFGIASGILLAVILYFFPRKLPVSQRMGRMSSRDASAVVQALIDRFHVLKFDLIPQWLDQGTIEDLLDQIDERNNYKRILKANKRKLKVTKL